MYYGIEQSTDLRDRKTKIVKFRYKGSLIAWIREKPSSYTYDDPVGARNHHKSFREGYHLEGRVNRGSYIFKDRGTSLYPRTDNDNLASYAITFGFPVEVD